MNDTVVIGGNQRLRNTVSGQANLRNVQSGAPNSSIRVVGSRFDENGTYPNLTAGNITSDTYTEDSVPYLFRQSGGGVRVCAKEEDTIVGGSIAWNQMASLNPNDWITPSLVSVSASDKNIIITCTSSNSGAKYARIKLEKDHIYFANAKINSTGTSIRFGHYNDNTSQNATVIHYDGEDDKDATLLFKATAISNTSPYLGGYIASASAVGTSGVIKSTQCFDLTQMFGSAVADYIYSLETANAGAGVAFFRNLFSKPYYAYNAGQLMHVSGLTSHTMRDADDNVIGSYALDSTLTLRGIPKLVDGKVCYDGDTYASDGTVTRKYGIVDLGTLTWSASSTAHCFYARISAYKMGLNMGLVCSRYTADGIGTGTIGYYGANGTIRYNYTATPGSLSYEIYIHDDGYSDAPTFKTAMNGVYLVYELATPTTETATGFTNPQAVDADGTEEYVITTSADVVVPVGHVTKYPTDMKEKLDGLPWDFSTLIAPTEKTFKATRAYVAKDFLIVDNVLYKVTASIANGANITVGTNVVATTIGEVLKTLI